MRLISIAAFSLLASPVFAEPLLAPAADASTLTAVEETKALMGDPKALAEYSKTHPEAASANSQVESLTGGHAQDSAAVYKLASEIFSNMAKVSNGDAAGMQATLAEAMKNPQAFAEKLSPEQRQQLQSLTKSIETRAPTSSPH